MFQSVLTGCQICETSGGEEPNFGDGERCGNGDIGMPFGFTVMHAHDRHEEATSPHAYSLWIRDPLRMLKEREIRLFYGLLVIGTFACTADFDGLRSQIVFVMWREFCLLRAELSVSSLYYSNSSAITIMCHGSAEIFTTPLGDWGFYQWGPRLI